MKDDMGNRIDHYFREGLDNLNVIPPAGVWDSIAESLHKKKGNRKMFMWIAMAASVALFAAVGGWFYLQKSDSISGENVSQVAVGDVNKKQEQTFDTVEKTEKIEKIEKNHRSVINTLAAENGDSTPKVKEDSGKPALANNAQLHKVRPQTIQVQPSLENRTEKTITTEESVANGKEAVPAESISLLASVGPNKLKTPKVYGKIKSSDQPVIQSPTPVYEELYAFQEITEPTVKKDRWGIGGQIAPLYSYRNISEVNAPGLSKSSMDQIEKAVITYASGVMVDYQASSRLTFQSGVYYMRMGQEIQNVSNFSRTHPKSALMASSMKDAVEETVTNSTGTIESPSANLYFAGSPNSNNEEYSPGNLALQPADSESKRNIEQSFEFIEVPFFAKYKILNRKINVHLLGGLSTHVLVNNKTKVTFDDNTVDQGKTTNVETFNYSSSVGFGVVYNLRKNLLLSIEPTFKCYINSFNSSEAVKLHPYALGIYSGISFKF